MFTIDKSRFDEHDLAEYNRLIAKGMVDPEAAEKEMEGDKPGFPPKKTKKPEVDGVEDTKKSADPQLAAAMQELQNLKKSMEMKEMAEIAKKYAPLGKNETELAQTLYDMKKSSEPNFNAYIAILDESLGLVEKSGLFAEIGKSAHGGSAPSDAVAKADAKAQEIMKNHPDMTYSDAVAKAWEDPSLMAEYDAEYMK